MSEFYVYIYWNPLKNLPFYVGKGKNERAFDHLQKSCKQNRHKFNTIQKIREAGLEPKITLAWTGNDETFAFRVEKFLIALWKRTIDGGILVNLTLGGEGSTGCIRSEETR